MLVEQDIANEVAAFIRERESLIEKRSPRWVLFADGKFQRAFDDYSSAVDNALKSGLLGRFLIRDLYAEPAYVPFVMTGKR